MAVRQRLSKEERRAQLLAVTLDLIRDEGVDAVTLARVAERAGVTKPIAYDHFGTRTGLLTALYLDYDRAQTAALREALAAQGQSAGDAAGILASAIIECAVETGPEISAVAAALEGSPEKEEVLLACRDGFVEECRRALAPYRTFEGEAGTATLIALLGAGEALSRAAAGKDVSPQAAVAALRAVILAALDAPPTTRP